MADHRVPEESRDWDAGQGLCREHGFGDAPFYSWRSKFDGREVPEARRLRNLEAEKARLKKPSAEFATMYRAIAFASAVQELV